MLPEQENHFNFSTIIIGVAGLCLVVWAVFSYLQGWGFFKNKTTLPDTPAADYSAVGQSAQVKIIPSQGQSAQEQAQVQTKTQPKNLAATLPYQIPPFDASAWVYDWGAASITNGVLSFGAATSTTGGDLFLANSGAWVNYSVDMSVDWQAGESFGIIARMAAGKNFVYCDFGDKTAAIVQRTNGTDATVAQGVAPNGGVGTTEDLGISVYGNQVACTIDGSEVLGTAIAQNDSAAGGIGLISWDATPGASRIVVNNLSANALATDSIIAPFSEPTAPATTVAPAPAAATNETSLAPAAVKQLELPYTETNFANDPNWQRTWGAMTIDSSNFMDIGSATDTTGGSVMLENTDKWVDYRLNTTVNWIKGETFMVMGRYVDNNNYVACEFAHDPNDSGGVMIELEKVVNGNEITLQTGEDTNFVREGNDNIAIVFSLQSTQATCSFNDHSVSNTGSNSYAVTPVVGSLGFSTWDPALNDSEIVVRAVSVAED